MKRQFLLVCLLCLGLLWGCAYEAVPTVSTVETTTEPTPPPNLVQQGSPWDEDGMLTEIFFTVSGAWKYTYAMGFGDQLLLYGYDSHLGKGRTLELLVVDPVTGEAQAMGSVSIKGYATPQIFQEQIYICDSDGGKIYQLSGDLSITSRWESPAQEGYWFVGAENILYKLGSKSFDTHNLTTGDTQTVIDQYVGYYSATPNGYVQITYLHPDKYQRIYAILDLNSGELLEASVAQSLNSAEYAQGVWLCRLEKSGNIAYLDNGETQHRIALGDDSLQLLQEGYLMETTLTPRKLILYGTDGKFVSSCQLSADENYYLHANPIWNEALGGYFLIARSYEGDIRFLFWDLNKASDGEDLPMEPVPAPSEAMAALRTRADRLEEEYGISIRIGEECTTEFYGFKGTVITDWEEIALELDDMEKALRNYPQGFFRQLRYDDMHGIQIHLIQQLEATEGERVGGSYSAFAQNSWDHYDVVCDILLTNEYTYYHEFSHVIDSYLAWDAANRTDALYSETGWSSFNPTEFEYVYSYVDDFDWFDYDYHTDWFIDTYSTTFPTEDRARVMEYAMMSYSQYYFTKDSGLLRKLDYYSRCIRDAFDTTDWPEVTAWEQYL